MTAPPSAPRTALFQRKGAPVQTSNADSQGPGDQSGPVAETGEDGGAEMAMCPQCGCEFDPANPQDYAPPAGGAPGSDGGGADAIAALLGGGGAPGGAPGGASGGY